MRKGNLENKKIVSEFEEANVLSQHSEDKEKSIKNLEIQIKNEERPREI